MPCLFQIEEELEGLVTHLRNAKGSILVEWLHQVPWKALYNLFRTW